MSADVGFVGLGDQGFPIAERLLAGGYRLHVWARRPEVVTPLVAQGATSEPTLADLGGACQVIGVCVRDDAGVLEVVEQLVPRLRADAVILIHSTVLPATCHAAADAAATVGGRVLDAPVTGGRPGAQAGTLNIMVGGDPEVFDRVRPLLDTFGSARLLGPLGSGQLMKLLNNALLTAHLRLAYDAVAIAGELGLDPRVAEQVLLTGSGGSAAVRSMIRFRTMDLAHVGTMLAKDVHHFEAVSAGAASRTRVVGLANELLARWPEVAS
jgi:3-hydroxyisobutyrate dehydrogenase-like beta-hydroxyacid dehydrogenase